MFLHNSISELASRFCEICEYRSRVPFYPAPVLLTLIVIGLLSGCNTILGIEQYIRQKKETINQYLRSAKLEIPLHMPSDTTMLRTLHEVDYLDLLAVISEWSNSQFRSEKRHIAIDGKAVRACLKKCLGGTNPPYVLNAFDASAGVIHAQIQVGKKTNEAGEIYTLIKYMDLDNAFVTTDAAFSNDRVMKEIVKSGGHMIMPLKGNQPKLEEAASILMQTTKENNPSLVSHYEDDDNGVYLHGRICNRCYELITDPSLVGEMLKGTSFENCAHAVGMVERCREVVKYDENKERIQQPPESQTVYYLLDTNDISVEKFAMYVRDHWYGSEIIHYVLDTEFDEDLSRVCKGNGMQNFSILRNSMRSFLNFTIQKQWLLFSIYN